MIYVVRSGDYLSKIASEHGIADWRALYNHPDNAEFRRLRPNPNLIFPGDRLVMPDKRDKSAPAPTGDPTRLRAHRACNTLQVRLLDFEGNPMANRPATLVIDGASRPVTTDGDGKLNESIPPHLTHAHLTINGLTITLAVGKLNPMDDVDDDGVSGVQGRLANLGYYEGPIDGEPGGFDPRSTARCRAPRQSARRRRSARPAWRDTGTYAPLRVTAT
jgi:N-acetylmuramoyl-L-alanine amidase